MRKNFLTPWTHEFLPTQIFIIACFLSFDLCEVSAFCFLHSDNENPKKDAVLTPSVEATATDEPSLQEASPVAKSPRDPMKKVVSTRGSKHLKKSIDTGASLDTHQPTSSSDDVRIDPGIFAFVPCMIFIFTCFSIQILMKKLITLGTECVEYLKATRASQGNLFSCALLVSSAFLCFFIRLSFPFFVLQMLWWQVMLAFRLWKLNSKLLEKLGMPPLLPKPLLRSPLNQHWLGQRKRRRPF
jgi:hypothetical protein